MKRSYIIEHKTASLRRILTAGVACVICMMSSVSIQGQSDPLYTQAWALPTLYNPAASGSTDFLRIRGAARMQWQTLIHIDETTTRS